MIIAMAIDPINELHQLPLHKIAAIGAFGVGAQWLAWRLRLPAIVLLAAAGLMLGPLTAILFGDPFLDPVNDFGGVYRPMIALAVALILFEGGLLLEFRELRDARKAVLRLVILGAPLGWLFGALAARYAAGLPWPLAWMLGGLFVVTGPTVILPLLRQAHLKARPAALLKWEGIVNDPVGALLAVAVLNVMILTSEGQSWLSALGLMTFGSIIAGIFGVAGGLGLAAAFRRGLIPEYLKAPIILVSVIVCFVASDMIVHETGLLAVTVLGLTIANSRLASIDDMRRVKETIATILVSGVFIMLTATLTPEAMASLDWRALAFVAAMLFLVRPATIWLATIKSGLKWQERALVGWIAPRGVVAVAVAGFFAAEILAIGPDQLGLPADQVARLAPLTFALVFATILAHGFTIGPLARRLGLATDGTEGVLIVGANPWSLDLAKALHGRDIQVTVADTNWTRLRRARLEGLKTYYGEILSESADHRLDHSSFDWLIAATPNDAYNALICVTYAPELGRHRVFQLPSPSENSAGDRGIAFTSRGRTFIADSRTHEAVSRDWWRGWRFGSTALSESYTLDNFIQDRGEDIDLIAEIREGRFSLLGPHMRPKGGPGSVLVWFGEGAGNGAEKRAAHRAEEARADPNTTRPKKSQTATSS